MTIMKQIFFLLFLLPAISCYKQNNGPAPSNLTDGDTGMQVSFTAVIRGDTSRFLLNYYAGYQNSTSPYYTITAVDTNKLNLLYIELSSNNLDSGSVNPPVDNANFEYATHAFDENYYNMRLRSTDSTAPGVTVYITSSQNGVISGTFSGTVFNMYGYGPVKIQDGKFRNLALVYWPYHYIINW